MNELLLFLGDLAVIGWVYLGLAFAVAVGLLLFDRHPHDAAAQEQEPSQGRRAA